ncbi:MAG: hypothetical protein BWY17_01491 [Deltaproteobacteria bacterium ADurb.Bin207]|jgi:hypothetical protein|nr:MAG: hypothetical protein BWY17_01491 [Deltaproteobacteria bacterium ADurb.Bin207]
MQLSGLCESGVSLRAGLSDGLVQVPVVRLVSQFSIATGCGACARLRVDGLRPRRSKTKLDRHCPTVMANEVIVGGARPTLRVAHRSLLLYALKRGPRSCRIP